MSTLSRSAMRTASKCQPRQSRNRYRTAQHESNQGTPDGRKWTGMRGQRQTQTDKTSGSQQQWANEQ
eukprot:11155898-Lingulodinium_polyedra.AAC.1